MSFGDHALSLLRQMAGGRATFREHQLEAIEELVVGGGRVLLVERTGYGKSAVYFIATKLLRAEGKGPTILISPLLVLMRNQVEMARRLDLRAETVNSSNVGRWEEIYAGIGRGEVDLLLISPERLNNRTFVRDQLPRLASDTGLLVIDEVHCISDWGHDFRPDYRRLSRVLQVLPRGVPILGTTATANDRVVRDVQEQLGTTTSTFRGSMDRESLTLGVKRLGSPSERLAYLAALVPSLPGSGIVYCLTIRDALLVATWLESRGIPSAAYSGDTANEERLDVEERLLVNRVKVVAATSALGMGFDKPDLGFVIHYQSPGTPIAYYQQVGRAGRGVTTAYGLLLCGDEDHDIQDYFIDSAFPPKERAEEVVTLLRNAAEPMTPNQIMQRVNVRKSRLEAMLKILEVEGAVERVDKGWLRTLARWEYDTERVERVTAARREEQAAMSGYAGTNECRMLFLRRLLDDPETTRCGRCDNCTTVDAFDVVVSKDLVSQAREHSRSLALLIEPRRQWVDIGRAGFKGRIPASRQMEVGRALGLYGDGGWGSVVRAAKTSTGEFDDALVSAAARLVAERWRPDPYPEWVTAVPSTRHPRLVLDFAARLARELGLPFDGVVSKTAETAPQKEMENSQQQLLNVHAAFEVGPPARLGPVLLVDDVVDSRWTLTVIGAALRDAGVSYVYPFALARATAE